MKFFRRVVCIGGLCAAGCASYPQAENPLPIRPDVPACENPVLIQPDLVNPTAYPKVFEKLYSVLSEYFEVAYSNIHDGRIVCKPTIARGYDRPFESGSPDSYERLLATTQTMRHRCTALIKPVVNGGYTIQVTIYKELLDTPRPTAIVAPAIFRDTITVDRAYNIIDPTVPTDDLNWIPQGRDIGYEQKVLRRLQECQDPPAR